MSLLAALAAWADRAASTVLRFDLSRTDVVKWVYFARQVFAVIVLSVVSIAGLSAYVSTKQAGALLRESLESQALTVAEAAARAAFVPLTLEDEAALSAIAQSFRGVEHLGSLTIRSSDGRMQAALRAADSGTVLVARAPVMPLADTARARREAQSVGTVEAGMRTDWIDAKARSIALGNVALSGGLALALSLFGMLVTGRLVERTRELVGEARLVEEVRRANASLESFSYSVAHDLRAPLRAIDGFSQAALDEYGDKLGPEGRGYLERVRAGTRRMGQLITDLLALSRVSRKEMTRESLDLSAMAKEVAARLREGQPGREVELLIAPGLRAVGDPGLVRAALENLLGNAWKYTQRSSRARIEFGRMLSGGVMAYFVRDDGAGFDPAYANKLFKPFSRLHGEQEFEGTGIGLATVQRIIERHGGRIWAQGEVGKGATFYFTL